MERSIFRISNWLKRLILSCQRLMAWNDKSDIIYHRRPFILYKSVINELFDFESPKSTKNNVLIHHDASLPKKKQRLLMFKKKVGPKDRKKCITKDCNWKGETQCLKSLNTKFFRILMPPKWRKAINNLLPARHNESVVVDPNTPQLGLEI